MNNVLFSSKTEQWTTPQNFFDELDKEFHFNLDPCADSINHKTPKYFTKEQNGLIQDWGGIEFSATLPMEELFLIGLKNPIGKVRKMEHLLLC